MSMSILVSPREGYLRVQVTGHAPQRQIQCQDTLHPQEDFQPVQGVLVARLPDAAIGPQPLPILLGKGAKVRAANLFFPLDDEQDTYDKMREKVHEVLNQLGRHRAQTTVEIERKYLL